MPTTQAPSHPTPVEQKGYIVGDTFVVLANPDVDPTDADKIFDVGSIVTLFRDDGSAAPLFRLVSGGCRFTLADGLPGAYYSIDHVDKVVLGYTIRNKSADTSADTSNADDDYNRAMGILD